MQLECGSQQFLLLIWLLFIHWNLVVHLAECTQGILLSSLYLNGLNLSILSVTRFIVLIGCGNIFLLRVMLLFHNLHLNVIDSDHTCLGLFDHRGKPWKVRVALWPDGYQYSIVLPYVVYSRHFLHNVPLGHCDSISLDKLLLLLMLPHDGDHLRVH